LPIGYSGIFVTKSPILVTKSPSLSYPTIQINQNAITLEYASKEEIQRLRLRPKSKQAQLEQSIKDISAQLYTTTQLLGQASQQHRNSKDFFDRDILFNKIQELRRNQKALQGQLEGKEQELEEEKMIKLHLSGALALRGINVN